MLDTNERLGKLRQDQFAFEEMRVLDVVMMGHTEMWNAMQERDAIYANPDATDDDYMQAAELEAKYPSTTATRPKRAPANCCWARACRSTSTRAR
jgi:ATPase subunit of ABC transporter with duplicated ATPase domains